MAALTGAGKDIEKTKEGNVKTSEASPSQPSHSIDEGWATVRSTKTKKNIADKRPPLKLRPLDWSVPIITPSEFKDGAKGVALVSQREGEKVVEEMGQCSGQMAVLTPKAVNDQLSRKVQVKAVTEESRLVRVDRFLTTIGDVEVKLSHELHPGSCTMNIPNNTCRIVLQMQERFVSKSIFSDAKAAPKATFYKWATTLNVEKEILYMSSPFLKESEDQRVA